MNLKRLVCLIGLVITMSQLGHGSAQTDRVMSPLAVLTGKDSHVTKQAHRRIASPAEWKKVWLEHLGLKEDTIHRPAMEVDFSRCEVVALFQGESTNTSRLRTDSLIESDHAVVVRFETVAYQTSADWGKEDHGNSVTPYAFIVISKSQKEIRLEENVSRNKGQQPPQWKEVARLAAPEH